MLSIKEKDHDFPIKLKKRQYQMTNGSLTLYLDEYQQTIITEQYMNLTERQWGAITHAAALLGILLPMALVLGPMIV